MSDYLMIPGFENVYLENGWVLDVRAEPCRLMLDVEIVLLESHLAYSEPVAGEQYCYLRGSIRFERVSELNWSGQGISVPAVDASGERDFGSIDEFTVGDGAYVLEGDFGRIEVKSRPPTLAFSP